MPPGQMRRGIATDGWIATPASTVAVGQDLTSDEGSVLIQNTAQLGLPDLADRTTQAYALDGDAIVSVNIVRNDGGSLSYVFNSTVRRAAFPGQPGG